MTESEAYGYFQQADEHNLEEYNGPFIKDLQLLGGWELENFDTLWKKFFYESFRTGEDESFRKRGGSKILFLADVLYERPLKYS